MSNGYALIHAEGGIQILELFQGGKQLPLRQRPIQLGISVADADGRLRGTALS